MATSIKTNADFLKKVCEKSGVDATACYQCLKCSAGCPIAEKTDSTPAHIIRKLVLGMKDELLQGDFIWMCVGCETCKTRCPQDLSARKIVDALKEIALEEGIAPTQKNVALLQKTFLNIMRTRGRMNEPLLMMHYKLGSKDYTGDMELGMKMIKKGKMPLNPLGGKIKGAAEVRNIIDKKGDK